ncbi:MULTISPECIES: TIGR03621 family F420-dependent LLM class oxidoreductase [unclassified Nocardia]|uniref:TIGR03621 family F420-dependent LLM class oxidoreductase n=1 Tax=unclassified Nocardia TaxID=2637762 RepID=UPI001CE43757|nr:MULTISPECIES: TIGR03621 family F420-dependent LLM class oxidoreductase [unclassified Nocardia]
MTVARDFRFGVTMMVAESRSRWREKCRRAEELGFDVIGVSDHLGTRRPAPFPALLAAAEATERVRLTTFVLNAAFYTPALLARDAVTLDLCTDGRVELGLGAGYVKAEFDAAGIPFRTGGQRVAHLAEVVTGLRSAFTGTPPRILLAGWGDRLLRLAAEQADIVALPGASAVHDGGRLRLAGPGELDARIAYVRGLLGARAATVEFNSMIQRVAGPGERSGLLDRYARIFDPELVAAPEEMPTLLLGTPREMAARVRERADRYGFTYFTVLEDAMETFAPVLELLR